MHIVGGHARMWAQLLGVICAMTRTHAHTLHGDQMRGGVCDGAFEVFIKLLYYPAGSWQITEGHLCKL